MATEIDVVVGAQFGSEAKGHVTQRLIDKALDAARNPLIYNIRVAGPNAGHTAHTLDGVKVAFRQLPVGALRTRVQCMIAPGSEVDPDVLLREIDDAIRFADFDPEMLTVDPEATLLLPGHVVAEEGMHERMGSTGKGIGAARAARIMRSALRVADAPALTTTLRNLGVRVEPINDALMDTDSNIIIEGTQGYGLGLHAGYYPYCTSSDCRAIDFLAMAGINPWWWYSANLRVWAVARTFPIRVAGNSGPLNNETSWEELGLPPEFTTVTKKMRRVGRWDQELVNRAVEANGGEPIVRLAITMLDQLFPQVAGIDNEDKIRSDPQVMDWLDEVAEAAVASIDMATTGPNTGVNFGG